MKLRPPLHFLLSSLLCLGLLTTAAPAANPLKAIGSGIKKVGSALTPWKKKEAPEAPAPVAKPAASKPAASSKPAAPKSANKKTVASRTPSKPRKSGNGNADAAESTGTPKRKGASGSTTEVSDAKSKAKSKNKEHDAAMDSTKETPADASTPPEGAPAVAAEAKPAPIPLADLPFGTPVMGKRGYVRSPYAEDQGMVDVTDIPAGTKVKCPFSGKIFRVP